MTGGLIQLVAYGVQDIFLTKDPQITYFKTVYRRHTNFSTEMIPQHFSSEPNFGDKVSATLSRAGDLVRKIYLVIELPPVPKLLENSIVSDKLKFGWVKYIGYAIIKSIEVELGGQSIDKHYSEWMYIWHELVGPKNRGFDKMVGNVPLLTDYTNSKDSYKLYIPLQFWFCRVTGLAIPLVNLQYNEMKINLELNEARKCYISSPKNYIVIDNDIVHFKQFEFIEQNVDGVVATGKFIYYDMLTRRLYYNRISKNTFLAAADGTSETVYNKYIITGTTTDFTTIPTRGYSEKTSRFPRITNFNLKECYLLVEYIYLDKDERVKFSQSTHEYLIEQIQFSGEKLIESTNVRIRLGFNHPCKEFIWVGQLNYLIDLRNNDIFNFTNSYKSGTNIISKQTIQFNGHERVSLRSSDYFDKIQVYQNHSHSPQQGINVYSFCLYPELYQPSGPCNMSKIDNIDLQLTMDSTIKLDTSAKLRMYGVVNNVLRISNGLSGLVFN